MNDSLRHYINNYGNNERDPSWFDAVSHDRDDNENAFEQQNSSIGFFRSDLLRDKYNISKDRTCHFPPAGGSFGCKNMSRATSLCNIIEGSVYIAVSRNHNVIRMFCDISISFSKETQIIKPINNWMNIPRVQWNCCFLVNEWVEMV